MSSLVSPAVYRMWMEVITLLIEAADRGAEQASMNPAVHSLAAGADGVASGAIALLPAELRPELDDIELDEATGALGVVGLIWAAELLTRQHRIEDLPLGASAVLIGLGDLIGRARE